MKTSRTKYALIVLLVAFSAATKAQIQYKSGQNVAPVFEGWERNVDGTFSLMFGYLNRNYEEQIDIPIGPNNVVEPGGDRGQPTHFYPRRERLLFKVVVPKDWDKNRRVTWTLTSAGRTDVAKGWLQPEWAFDQGVIAQLNGGGPIEEGNQPPTITGAKTVEVSLPSVAVLNLTATDDGLPKPRALVSPSSGGAVVAPANAQEGVRIRWIHFRGPGKVTFESETARAPYGKPLKLATKAQFSAPGTYVLRAIASDLQLESTYEITVNVKPGGGR